MKVRIGYITFGLFVFATILTSCKKENSEDDAAAFDKSTLLTNIADNEIAPNIASFNLKIEALKTAYLSFQANITQANLEVVRGAWKEAYLSWQSVKIFDFGPIRDYGLKGAIGTYPTDTVKIENNVASGSYDLETANNVDAIGLPSLDYLLHRENALSFFIANNNYTTYGLDVITKMKSEVNMLETNWSGYRATFIESTGTETTSSFSQLVNEFSRDYELAKNSKLAIPLGKQSLGIQLPEYIEARRSGLSLEILKSSILSLRSVFKGKTGVGFDDYLIQLERSSLSTTIDNRFQSILNKIDSFNGTLEEEMQANTAELDNLYTLVQGQVVNIKTDMSSAFGVLITYQDNDGD